MSDCFSVTISSLQALANELTSVTDSMGDLQGNRDSWGDAVRAGLEDVDDFETDEFKHAGDRVRDYLGDWSNGIDQIKSKTEKLAQALTDAAQAYNDADNQLANALTGPTSS